MQRKPKAPALLMDRFAFAREWLNHYAGQCAGKQGIDVLVKGLSQAILARDYVTTRVLVPEQDLSSGTLSLSLIPGVNRRVRFVDATNPKGDWLQMINNHNPGGILVSVIRGRR